MNSNIVIKIAEIVLVVCATIALERVLSFVSRKHLKSSRVSPNVTVLLAKSITITVWWFGFVFILSILGVEKTPLATFSGLVIISITLSLQAILGNIFSGVYLLLEHPFKVGDYLLLPTGQSGVVTDIKLRATYLVNLNQERVIVPNSMMFSGVVTNQTVVGGYSARLTVSFARDMNVQETIDLIAPMLIKQNGVLDTPSPFFHVGKVTSDFWFVTVMLWVQGQETISSLVRTMGSSLVAVSVTDGTIV